MFGVDCLDSLKILNCGNYFTIVNVNGNEEHHAHVKRRSTAELLVRLVRKKRVPDSSYLRTSAKRLTLSTKYIRDINIKIGKDKNKQSYYNKNNNNIR